MTLTDTVVSYIRTYVPAAAGSIIGWAVANGLPVEKSTQDSLTAVLIVAFIALWYALARVLEKRFPAAGWLLGVPRQPLYASAKPVGVELPATGGDDTDDADPVQRKAPLH